MKLLIVTAPLGHQDTVRALLQEEDHAQAHWHAETSLDRFTLTLVVATHRLQRMLDTLQRVLQASSSASIHTINIESSYPQSAIDAPRTGLNRWELTQIADAGARSDRAFLLLVALSTLVAAVGLARDNVAVVIGAMVIAPLLSPNLSFALATALAQTTTALRALRTLVLGTAVSFAIALAVGLVWQNFPIGQELLSRTQVSPDGALLALASGAAAVLSLTRGISSVLVGVMVAVALIPPLATAGMFIGHGMFERGLSALLLFLVNVVAINLAAHVTFALAGVAPRTEILAKSALRRTVFYIAGWTAALGGLYFLL